jgi:hypothetical protein
MHDAQQLSACTVVQHSVSTHNVYTNEVCLLRQERSSRTVACISQPTHGRLLHCGRERLVVPNNPIVDKPGTSQQTVASTSWCRGADQRDLCPDLGALCHHLRP